VSEKCSSCSDCSSRSGALPRVCFFVNWLLQLLHSPLRSAKAQPSNRLRSLTCSKCSNGNRENTARGERVGALLQLLLLLHFRVFRATRAPIGHQFAPAENATAVSSPLSLLSSQNVQSTNG
jgi:hypothetical protein